MRKFTAIAFLAVIITTLATPLAAFACGGGGNPYPPVARLAVGTHAMTSFTSSGDPLVVREKPGYDGKFLTQLYNGTSFTVIEGPVKASGYLYWKVTTDDGKVTGWIAEGAYDEYWTQPLN
jgi:hypothetical protein